MWHVSHTIAGGIEVFPDIVYSLRKKDEVLSKFMVFKNLVERQTDRKLKCLRKVPISSRVPQNLTKKTRTIRTRKKKMRKMTNMRYV